MGSCCCCGKSKEDQQKTQETSVLKEGSKEAKNISTGSQVESLNSNSNSNTNPSKVEKKSIVSKSDSNKSMSSTSSAKSGTFSIVMAGDSSPVSPEFASKSSTLSKQL